MPGFFDLISEIDIQFWIQSLMALLRKSDRNAFWTFGTLFWRSALQTGGIDFASIEKCILSSSSFSIYCHLGNTSPFSETTIPGTKCCFDNSSSENFETLLQNLRSVPMTVLSCSIHAPESELSNDIAFSGGMLKPSIFHGIKPTGSSGLSLPLSFSRSGDAWGDLDNVGSDRSTSSLRVLVLIMLPWQIILEGGPGV